MTKETEVNYKIPPSIRVGISISVAVLILLIAIIFGASTPPKLTTVATIPYAVGEIISEGTSTPFLDRYPKEVNKLDLTKPEVIFFLENSVGFSEIKYSKNCDSAAIFDCKILIHMKLDGTLHIVKVYIPFESEETYLDWFYEVEISNFIGNKVILESRFHPPFYLLGTIGGMMLGVGLTQQVLNIIVRIRKALNKNSKTGGGETDLD